MNSNSLALLVLLLMVASLLIASTAFAQPPPPFLGPEDLNGDGTVDGKDFAIFNPVFIAFRDTGTITNSACDFNSDGKVDYFDAMLMIEGYLATHK